MTPSETPEEMEAAAANFKLLVESPGWKLLSEVINANIDVVRERIINGTENETTDSINRLRDKLTVYNEVLNTPRDMIERLTRSSEPEETEYDPYETVDQLKERKRKSS